MTSKKESILKFYIYIHIYIAKVKIRNLLRIVISAAKREQIDNMQRKQET